MRLIDADELFKALGFAEPCSECDHVIGRFCADQIWADVCDAIIDAPTIDAVPVRRGKWERYSARIAGWVKCSECGNMEPPLCATRFCGHCGAKMEEAEP